MNRLPRTLALAYFIVLVCVAGGWVLSRLAPDAWGNAVIGLSIGLGVLVSSAGILASGGDLWRLACPRHRPIPRDGAEADYCEPFRPPETP